MEAVRSVRENISALGYHVLRYALERYGKNITQLEPEELEKTRQLAQASFELESRVLATPEAAAVIISDTQIDRSVSEVASRYTTHDEFVRDLASNALSEEQFRHALLRELRFNGVMQKIAASSPEVSDIDIELFYNMHRDQFQVPELRQARHILITINSAYDENRPEMARARLDEVSQKLLGRSNRFADFARRFSECPTAMEGGKLGDVKRGQLFPELDAMLFSMEEREISPVVESEIGFHLLLCEKIKQGREMPLNRVRERIREKLETRRIKSTQKAWLDALPK